VRNGVVRGAVNRYEVLLRIAYCLVDSKCGVCTLSKTNTDTTLLVANNYCYGEGEAATAGHNAGHAANLKGSLLELRALARSTRTATTRVAATATHAATTARSATTIVARWSCWLLVCCLCFRIRVESGISHVFRK
jgi:hypothetical protein